MSKSQAGGKTSLGAFPFVCDHVTPPVWTCKELQSLQQAAQHFIFARALLPLLGRVFFPPLPSSALCLGEGWGGGEVKRDSCLCALCVRGDYVSDQSKHEYYKHSPSSLGCRPDITGLDSLECLDVHLAKGRSRRAAVHGWNSLWSSASTCVCVWVWVRVCVSVQCNFTTQVHQLVHVKVPR